MPITATSSNRPMVILLSAVLALILLMLSFPDQSQWLITRYMVNSSRGYEKYIETHPQSPFLEKASWRYVQLKNDPALFLDFAADFPNSPKREEALWTAAKKLRTAAVYAEYLQHFPEGKLAKAEGVNVNRLRISATVYKNEQKRATTLQYGKVVDLEGNTYRSIQLGGLAWTADNLNLYVKGLSSCFQHHNAYCRRFGKLYTWIGAQEACKRLGSGWRLPSLEEWEKLFRVYDQERNFQHGSAKAFNALLRGGKSGFEVRGAGYFTPESGFTGAYYDAGFWTNTPTVGLEAYQVLFLGRSKMAYHGFAAQGYALSCRCVRDSL
ncbi:MAG TPA: FISUMP domain-containing protein [Haliscomenobacter sp.]|uniref:FISUMP domain-containing protein n=1 Tax=Haliscomenobacter sp. TaxID=2717303 RepID=UPI002B549853|nr:FISUMP domain-containing protein [Haliscomenobacter sp.]HOY18480.1 FISUMP domain-containing protein [Haliscomenobacter sp.]HPH20456.1 FISUMP domain-containing protein [Haliscomenobacter sp.]